MISGPHLLRKLFSPFIFYNPPCRQRQTFQKSRIFKSFQHPAVLAHRDVCPTALRQETVPGFLTCASPWAVCASVPPFSQPVEALPDLLLGSYTVACVGAVGNIQGTTSIPVDQDVPGIVHTLAGSLGARLRGMHIIHLIQDDPAAFA